LYAPSKCFGRNNKRKKLSPQKWLQQKIIKEEKNIKLLACQASSSKEKKPCNSLNTDVIYSLR